MRYSSKGFRAVRLMVVTIVATLILGCSSLQPYAESKTVTTVPVEFKSPNRLRFSGKGSGAGMMLMSSMGATGIAIGVAIDEGIGKDIAEALAAGNYAFPEQFDIAVQGLEENYKKRIQSILIERYGFKTKSQEGYQDAIVPEIQVKIELVDGTSIKINYPKDFSESLPFIELEEAKLNSGLSAKALSIAIAEVMAKFETKF